MVVMFEAGIVRVAERQDERHTGPDEALRLLVGIDTIQQFSPSRVH
jgi:hypothetical protein